MQLIVLILMVVLSFKITSSYQLSLLKLSFLDPHFSNRNLIQCNEDKRCNGALHFYLYKPSSFSIMVENSSFFSNEITGALIINNTKLFPQVAFNNVTVFNNSPKGVKIISQGNMMLDVALSTFSHNNNGALVLEKYGYDIVVEFNEVTFVRNGGSYDSQGTALYITSHDRTTITFNKCILNITLPPMDSIVYIANQNLSLEYHVVVSLKSSRFINNQYGSALHVSRLILVFDNLTLFENNSADVGSAIYVEPNSLITIGNASLVQLVSNTASLRGGAIYSDLSNCFSKGILFSNISNFSSFMFISNTARISGNSIYLHHVM